MLLQAPLRWLPDRLTAEGLAFVLNRVMADALAAGELDFLRGKTIGIEVSDLDIGCRLRLARDGFAAAGGRPTDVRFIGDAHTLLLLVTQREDADTLFFQRRLRIEGDTATGVHLKNFLDAMGESPLPAPLLRIVERLADHYGRHCAADAQPAQAPQLSPGRPYQ
jgi:predicted lipid carrier protein YhbT